MTTRICYNCGKKFETEDKSASTCQSCFIILNPKPKPKVETVFVDAWKPTYSKQKKQNFNVSIFKLIAVSGLGLMALITLIFIIGLFATMALGV